MINQRCVIERALIGPIGILRCNSLLRFSSLKQVLLIFSYFDVYKNKVLWEIILKLLMSTDI